MPARKRKNSSSKKSITTTTTTTNATPNKKSNTRRASNRRGPPSLSKDDIIVGGKYMIIGGEWSKQQTDDVNATYVAEILAIRETSNRTNGKDFYVHFEGLDKRLDEWIDIDRIVCEDENDEDGNSFQSPINQRSSNSRQNSHNKRARLDLSKVDQDDHSNNVSLKRFESRPSNKSAKFGWEYLFYIDIEGHMKSERVKKSLDEVRAKTVFFKNLGSYPLFEKLGLPSKFTPLEQDTPVTELKVLLFTFANSDLQGGKAHAIIFSCALRSGIWPGINACRLAGTIWDWMIIKKSNFIFLS